MRLPKYLARLTFEQAMMIILTAIIAFCVVVQTINMREQSRILADSEKRTRERNKPTAKLTSISHGVRYYNDSGKPQEKSFVGFSIANASPFDITITSIGLEMGIPIDKDRAVRPQISIPPVTSYKEWEISDFSLPRRLQYGETLQVLYDEADAAERLKRQGNGNPVRVLPFCYDSLGNKYTMDYWITWEVGVIRAFEGPEPGHITFDEWNLNPK